MLGFTGTTTITYSRPLNASAAAFSGRICTCSFGCRFPFATGWVGANHLAPTPSAAYGVVLLMAALAYWILQHAIIVQQGRESLLATAIGKDWKGKLSPALYFAAILLAFLTPWLANGIYVLVAMLWLIPDRRIEHVLEKRGQ